MFPGKPRVGALIQAQISRCEERTTSRRRSYIPQAIVGGPGGAITLPREAAVDASNDEAAILQRTGRSDQNHGRERHLKGDFNIYAKVLGGVQVLARPVEAVIRCPVDAKTAFRVATSEHDSRVAWVDRDGINLDACDA